MSALNFTVNSGIAVGTDRIHCCDDRRLNYTIRNIRIGVQQGRE